MTTLDLVWNSDNFTAKDAEAHRIASDLLCGHRPFMELIEAINLDVCVNIEEAAIDAINAAKATLVPVAARKAIEAVHIPSIDFKVFPGIYYDDTCYNDCPVYQIDFTPALEAYLNEYSCPSDFNSFSDYLPENMLDNDPEFVTEVIGEGVLRNLLPPWPDYAEIIGYRFDHPAWRKWREHKRERMRKAGVDLDWIDS